MQTFFSPVENVHQCQKCSFRQILTIEIHFNEFETAPKILKVEVKTPLF